MVEKRLIDANALLAFEKMDAELCASCGEEHTANDIIMMIKTAPTVDAVEVVRCERCIRYKGDIVSSKHSRGSCEFDNERKSRNHFCSYGERKDGNT